MKRKPHYTSWAAVFAVGAELSRRGYDAALTLGNCPRVDLLCDVPDGRPFKVQVKGISWQNGFWVQKEFFNQAVQDDLFLIVVYVPKPGEEDHPFDFHILSHDDAKKANSQISQRLKKQAGEGGLGWGELKPFKNAWHKLPKCHEVENKALG